MRVFFKLLLFFIYLFNNSKVILEFRHSVPVCSAGDQWQSNEDIFSMTQ